MHLLACFAVLFAADALPAAPADPALLELERHSPAVRGGRLVEDVGLETLGGVFTPLLLRNQAVPVEKTETFSTAADNYDEIEIKLFRGVEAIARKNTLVGRFAVSGLPRAPRGAVKVAVTFSIKADGTITVTARESAGRSVALRRQHGILSFDCTSTDEMKRGESLRARRSGGPEGAAWNWYGSDLLCTIVLRGTCDGTAKAVLMFRREPVARATAALSRQATVSAEIRVPAKVWERALTHRKDLARLLGVYDFLSLDLNVDSWCTGAARSTPPETWSDSFYGVFSGGE